ncbi:WLM-domain-containing protein [Hesseltinella vesiculosa]|uniref:WLM-domain-containing protein n=1 Tax=Hesseltinella vesiculosa TaxID=101127 RepID=A0A1X2GIX6_9FUNG|nr:WLM-domain-containing protein [Hesseltinella vesiculosa]
MSIDFKVAYKGTTYALGQWPLSATIDDVKDWLETETSILKQGQKLLWKGKVLTNDATLESIGIIPDAKIMLMGSPQQQIDAVHSMDRTLQQRAKVTAAFARHPKKRTAAGSSRSLQDVRYTFHQITVLPEFQGQDKARKLLERLRDDRGIQGIMQHYKWSVGELAELSPFEHAILGYNRNAGERIALRLRTDDLSGFRHYDTIRKVLLHELTHNVWGDHDENFHKLNRQLNKDVITMDVTFGGRTLQAVGPHFEPEEEEETGLASGSHRLGGQGTIPISIAERRERAVQAAMYRLTKQEEQEMDEGCGS